MLPNFMTTGIMRAENADAETIYNLYKGGYFAYGHADDLYWVEHEYRAVFNLREMNIPRSVRREILNKKTFDVTVNQDFPSVVHACSRVDVPGKGVWINGLLSDTFNELHQAGLAHSVECRKDGELVGGLFGITIGRVFLGNSIFNTEPNAGKVALTHLAARLWHGGFTMLDSQTENAHLQEHFGQYLLPRYIFRNEFNNATRLNDAEFDRPEMPSEYEMVRNYVDFLNEEKKKHDPHQRPKIEQDRLSGLAR